jgi:hypothetical protein
MAQIQIGVEEVKNGKRTFRVTPIDSKFHISDAAWQIIKAVFAMLDASDKQPGDGDIDIELSPALLESLEKSVPALKALNLPKGANLFLRAK